MAEQPEDSKRKDPGWKHGVLVDPSDRNTVKCIYCNKVTKGGIHRHKLHLIGGNRNVKMCLLCPSAVRQELKEYEEKKKKQKMDYQLPDFEEAEDEEQDVQPLNHKRGSSSQGQAALIPNPKKPKGKGPIHSYFQTKPETVVERRKRQTSIDEGLDKERRAATIQYIAKFFYQAGNAFNQVKLDAFKHMVEAIGQYGPNLKPPSYHEMRVTMLKKEVDHTRDLLKEHERMWALQGCSIMSDGWTSRTGQTIINFLVNSRMGSAFIESVNASSYSKTGEKTFELLDAFVEKIGEDNVVQLHQPLHAAAHYLNPEYYYANPQIQFDEEVMDGLYKCIQRLVKDEDEQTEILNELIAYQDAKGLFGSPLAVKTRNTRAPTDWWSSFGATAPNLQRLAIKILNLTCSASGCERNWSVFEQLHSPRRNKLLAKTLNDLVFVKYNQALKARYDSLVVGKNKIALDDIDESNEWLEDFAEGDDDDHDAANDPFFLSDDEGGQNETGLTFGMIAAASGAEEPVRQTRKQARSSGPSGSGPSSVGARNSKTYSKSKNKGVSIRDNFEETEAEEYESDEEEVYISDNEDEEDDDFHGDEDDGDY